MRDLEWFIDEGPELARLAHYVWKDSALDLNHRSQGHTKTQMRRLDGLVFPGMDYPGLVNPSVILICPKQVWGITVPANGQWWGGQRRESDKEDANYWFSLRSLFTTYYGRRRTAQRLGNLTDLPPYTTTVRRSHLHMLVGVDGAPGEVRDGVAA